MSKNMSKNQSDSAGFGVAPSPFNGVKLELAVVMVLGLCVWMAAEFITASDFVQIIVLLGFSLVAAVWLITRTRILFRQEMEKKSSETGSAD